jgi:two-component sensor histidine kinase/PAS domain-containing protein
MLERRLRMALVRRPDITPSPLSTTIQHYACQRIGLVTSPATAGREERNRPMNFEEANRPLRETPVPAQSPVPDAQAQHIVDTVPYSLLVLDGDLCVESANRAFCRTFQISHDETLGRRFCELGDGQWDILDLRRLLDEAILSSGGVFDYEVRHTLPVVGTRTMLLSARRLFNPDDTSVKVLLSIEDATARRRKEEEQDVLLGELRHRTKNLLGMVHALARQTEIDGRSVEEYRTVFLGRFEALVRSHDLWTLERTGADLGELVRLTLEPYATAPGKIMIEAGEAVGLMMQQALSLGMILHELAANAFKHGALSTPGGHVRIACMVHDLDGLCSLRLRWQEQGGPLVAAPSKGGFGTRLIGFALLHDLGGRMEMDYAPDGLTAEMMFPLS